MLVLIFGISCHFEQPVTDFNQLIGTWSSVEAPNQGILISKEGDEITLTDINFEGDQLILQSCPLFVDGMSDDSITLLGLVGMEIYQFKSANGELSLGDKIYSRRK